MTTRFSTEFSQLAVAPFNGEKYEFWSKKIKAYLVSLELWDAISNGYVEDEMRRYELRELKKKDAKVFFFNQSVTGEIYHRIYDAQKTHEHGIS